MSDTSVEQTEQIPVETIKGVFRTDVRLLGKGAAITLVGRLGGRGLLLLNQILLARLLGPAEFGLYALGWTVVQMGSVILPFGLHQGVVHYGARYWQVDDARLRAVIQQVLKWVALFALAGALLLWVGSSWIAIKVFKKPDFVRVLRGFAAALALATILRVAAAATRVSHRMQFSILSEDLSPAAIQLLLIVILVDLYNRGIKGALLSANAGFIGGLGLALFFLWRLFAQRGRSAALKLTREGVPLKELFAFSLMASMGGIFTMLTLRVDRLVVGYFLPSSEVGIYQAASQAAMLSAMVLSAFTAIFSPMIARLHYQGEMGRLNEMFKVSTKWGLYVSLPLFLVLAVAPREVMTIVFGRPYASGGMPMLIMAGAQTFNAGTGAVGLLLVMSGYPQQWMRLAFVSFTVNLLLCILLIPRLGPFGAALALAISVVILFGSGLINVHRLLGLWPYDRSYLKGIGATIVSLAVLFLYKEASPIPVEKGILWLTGMFLASTISMFSVLLFCPDEEVRTLLQRSGS